jgi:ferredoxin--NADP+ reductase
MSVHLFKNHDLQTVKIHEKKQIAQDVYCVSIDKLGEFEPGEVIPLIHDTELVPRLYSLAGSGKYWEILFNVVQGGALTHWLADAEVGTEIYAGRPSGSFRDPGVEGSYWIANGTGIAPFRAMIKSGLSGSRTLIFGARTKEHLYYHSEFVASENIRYIPCLSQDTLEHAHSGRLTEYLKTAEIDTAGEFALCGSTGMVTEVRDILIEKGVNYSRIRSEIYF